MRVRLLLACWAEVQPVRSFGSRPHNELAVLPLALYPGVKLKKIVGGVDKPILPTKKTFLELSHQHKADGQY